MSDREILGEGSFARVYRDGDKAIKEFDELGQYIIRETSAILGVSGNCFRPNEGKSYLLDVKPLEYSFSMKRFSDNLQGKIFTPPVAKYIIYRVLLQLYEAHKMSIIHADIKSNNILINSLPEKETFHFERYDPILADWGISQFPFIPGFSPSYRIQTINYRAPEVFLGLEYDFKIDIWSMGILYLELLGLIDFEFKFEIVDNGIAHEIKIDNNSSLVEYIAYLYGPIPDSWHQGQQKFALECESVESYSLAISNYLFSH